MINHFMNPIYERWLSMQLLTNSIGQDMTQYESLLEVRWQAKSWNWVDPLKDIKASVEGINAGIKGGIYLNAKDKDLKLRNSFKLKYRENLEDLSWLTNDLNNSTF